MKFQEAIKITDLIDLIRLEQDRDCDYCVYGKGDSSNIEIDSICYIDDYSDIDDDDNETYPDFVTNNSLELWYRDELVQDVVFNCLHQNKSVSNSKILEAIKYYSSNDCFMNI